MLAGTVYAAVTLIAAARFYVSLKSGSVLALLWGVLAYYSALSADFVLEPEKYRHFELLAGRVSGGRDPTHSALLYAGALGALLLGDLVPRLALHGSIHRVPVRPRFTAIGVIAVAAVATIAAAASCKIGAGHSYVDYVSGSSIGWGVSLAFLAASGVPLAAIMKLPNWMRVVLIAVGLIPSLMITAATGVRLLLIVPIGAALLACNISGMFAKRPALIVAAVLLAVPAISALNTAVLQPLRGGGSSTGLFPESEVISMYNILEPNISPGNREPLEPLMRFAAELASYPASKIGLPLPQSIDPATGFARTVHGRWATYFAHMPMTFVLDFKASVGPWYLLPALAFGALFSVADISVRRGFISVMFLPEIAVCEYLFARGAVSHAGQAISASVAFSITLLVVVWALQRWARAYESP